MVSSKEELIGKRVGGALPREIVLASGKRLLIRPLPPSVRIRSASLNKFEKILFILKKGIMQPELTEEEILMLMDHSLIDAVEIYNRIQKYCAEYDRTVLDLHVQDRDSEMFTVLEKIAEMRGEK